MKKNIKGNRVTKNLVFLDGESKMSLIIYPTHVVATIFLVRHVIYKSVHNIKETHLRRRMEVLLYGVQAIPPSIQGKLQNIYDIMKISCTSWSSLDVIYTHPPHVIVLMIPNTKTHVGRLEFRDLWL